MPVLWMLALSATVRADPVEHPGRTIALGGYAGAAAGAAGLGLASTGVSFALFDAGGDERHAGVATRIVPGATGVGAGLGLLVGTGLAARRAERRPGPALLAGAATVAILTGTGLAFAELADARCGDRCASLPGAWATAGAVGSVVAAPWVAGGVGAGFVR